jgi:hypothetical protein
MNRRNFISVLAGAAGAPLVPWRVLIDPIIALPPAGGWAARSVSELWLDYANQIRPMGVEVRAKVDPALNAPWRLQELAKEWAVQLTLAAYLPPSLERRMRDELLKEPATFNPTAGLGDFAPWEFQLSRPWNHILK